MLKDSFHEYGVISKVFHHTRLLLLIAIYTCVILANYIHSRYVFSFHMQFGITLFVVIFFNIIWRLFNKKVVSLALNKVEERIQLTTYFLIYFLLFGAPFIGFSTYCLRVSLFILNDPNFVYNGFSVFHVITIPVGLIKWYGDFLAGFGADPKSFVHNLGFYHKSVAIFVLPTLIAMHIIALMYHQFVVKNHILKRMF